MACGNKWWGLYYKGKPEIVIQGRKSYLIKEMKFNNKQLLYSDKREAKETVKEVRIVLVK